MHGMKQICRKVKSVIMINEQRMNIMQIAASSQIFTSVISHLYVSDHNSLVLDLDYINEWFIGLV